MWLDNIIGYISPVAALRRHQARLALSMVKRAYDGAKTGRRTDGWLTTGTSANTEIAASASKLRDRARDITRNNPFAKKAKRVFSDNFIGTGIIPQARTKSDKLNKEIMAAWEEWSRQCDAEGNCDFYGLQALIIRSVFESGECFIRYRDRHADHGLVPFQIQVLEADFLDATRNYELGGGNYIKQGIEFNKSGSRIAYWMWQEHPGENMSSKKGNLQSVRIPADQIIHIFEKDRPGQIRGVTSYASVLLKMRDLDDYDDAELWRKKIESCFAAFVTQNSGGDGPILGSIASSGGDSGSGSSAPKRTESFRPGMVEYLKPGEDVKFGNPSSDANYPNYMRIQLHAVAAGLGITYEQLTGDLSQVNYSSLRAGLLEFRRMIETLRWQVFIPMFCVPVWRRFIDRAFIAGAISKVDYTANWNAPKFEMIDPLKDAQADTLMMRNGTLTLKNAIANQGYDPDQQISEIGETNQLLDQNKIILDSDPRYTAKSGAVQSTQGDNNAATN